MPTASTLPLLIIIAILWRATRGNTLAIILFTAIFSAASALNIGSFGIAPWLFAFGLCCTIKLATRGFQPLRFPQGMNRTAVYLLLAFVVFTVGSAILFPYFFHGITVDHDPVSGPLTWSFSNFAQSLYLITSLILYLLTAGSSKRELREAMEWFIRGCITASAIAMYQLANAITHIPYPTPIFASNPSYTIYHAYQINGMWRLNSTFCEASEMSSYLMVGIVMLGWELAVKRIRPWRAFCFVMMLVSVLFTVSSVGYLCLILSTLIGSILYMGHLFRTGAPSHGRVIFGILLLLSMVGVFTLGSGLKTVNKVIDSTLTEKTSSDSYRARTSTHYAAIRVLENTSYMGAGWGSMRASGLAYTLLGTVGIIGLLLFLAFYLSLFRPLFYRYPVLARRDGNDLYAPTLFALSILLASMTIAGSEPVTPVIWTFAGIITVSRLNPSRRDDRRSTYTSTRAGLSAGSRYSMSLR